MFQLLGQNGIRKPWGRESIKATFAAYLLAYLHMYIFF